LNRLRIEDRCRADRCRDFDRCPLSHVSRLLFGRIASRG
jgi:hypothetical protein